MDAPASMCRSQTGDYPILQRYRRGDISRMNDVQPHHIRSAHAPSWCSPMSADSRQNSVDRQPPKFGRTVQPDQIRAGLVAVHTSSSLDLGNFPVALHIAACHHGDAEGNATLIGASPNPMAIDAQPDATGSERVGKKRRLYGLGGDMEVDATHLRNLRDRFIADPVSTDLSSLRPVVERSWRRSMMWNIDPDRRSFEDIHEPEVDDLVLRCAEPVLAELERLAADTGAHVILADPSGTVAVFRGDPEVRRVAGRLFPIFGGAMSEDIAGTNAEGTAIEEGTGVQIWGPEHFVASLEEFCCTSMPIHDPLRRAVRGFLSLSLPADVGMDVNPASIAWIVRGAAAEVTRRLAEGLAVREKSLLDSYLSEVRKRGAESVVVMDSRMTIATRGALEMLQPADYAVLAGYARESEQTSRPVEREVMLEPQRALH